MTSKIKIRPFIPALKDETVEQREPFAVLIYGNITIELDYTIMRSLTIDNKSMAMVKPVSIACAAFDEVIKEMNYDMTGTLPKYHRDNESYKKLISHYPLHPVNKEIEIQNENV